MVEVAGALLRYGRKITQSHLLVNMVNESRTSKLQNDLRGGPGQKETPHMGRFDALPDFSLIYDCDAALAFLRRSRW